MCYDYSVYYSGGYEHATTHFADLAIQLYRKDAVYN